jgi:RNA polymerase sigma-70 factor (ECF subfamily)
VNNGQESHLTSVTLLERARQHDAVAWRTLCDLYGPLVYCWARKAGVAQHDVPDIVQEVFRVVATHLGRFRRDRPGDTFRGWLITLTRTEILAFYRKRSREQVRAEGGTDANVRLQQIADLTQFDADLNRPEVMLPERHRLVRRCAELIQRDFDPRTWQAFWRSVIEEHDVTEIAAELKMTANAIRQARFRVLQRLRECVNELS